MDRLIALVRIFCLRYALSSAPLTVALATLLNTGPAGADTTFVWKDCISQVPPTCGSGSWANPYQTIQAAVNAVGGPGAIIAVRPAASAYKEQVSIAASGASGNPFTLLARGAITIDGGETATGWQQSGDIWSKSGISYNSVGQVITNDGLRYSKCSSCDLATLPVGQSFYDLSNSTIYFRCRSGTPCSYSGTTADLCVRSPITVTGSHVIVDGFTVLRSDDDGIRVGNAPTTPPPPSTGVIIKNCTVRYSARDGIEVRNSNNGTLSKNICSDNSRDGILLGYVNGAGVQAFVVADNVCNSNSNYGSSTYPRGDAQGIQIGQSVAISGQHTIERNKAYSNQDTGIEVNNSNDNVLRQNQSWLNKDHGFDHIASSGTKHISDLAYGNDRDGFSIESNAPSTTIQNCIMADNGRDPVRKDWELEVYTAAQTGFVSNYNVFYRPVRSDCHPDGSEDDRLINWGGGPQTQTDCSGCCTATNQYFATVATFTTQTGHDAQSRQGNPAFVDAAAALFRPRWSSPAVERADTTVVGWQTTDVSGIARHDCSGVTNAGNPAGAFGDIGPYEYDDGMTGIAAQFGYNWIQVSFEGFGRYGNPGWKPVSYDILVDGVQKLHRVSPFGPPADGWPAYITETVSAGACGSHSVQVRTKDEYDDTAYTDIIVGNTCCVPFCTDRPELRAGMGREERVDFALALEWDGSNPSSGAGAVRWSIPQAQAGAALDLSLFDVAGRRVSTIARGPAEAGRFAQQLFFWSGAGRTLPNGVFFLRLRVGSEMLDRTVVLTR